ncbi:hypothetical protein [Streptomyces sp. NPDC054958]
MAVHAAYPSWFVGAFGGGVARLPGRVRPVVVLWAVCPALVTGLQV